MFEELFKDYITQIKQQIGKDSRHGIAKHIEQSLIDGVGDAVLSYKTIEKYYKIIIEGDLSLSYAAPSQEFMNIMAIGLGYENYSEYLKENNQENTSKIINQHATGKYGININTDHFSGNLYNQDASKKD